MLDLFRTYATSFWWLAALSVVMFVGTLLFIPILVARIPADYFVRDPHHTPWSHRHPILRFLMHLIKNGVGVLCILAGLAMLVLPGQGVLTMLVGIMLMDFPGKRALEQRIVQQPKVLGAINWLRARMHQPPLQVTTPPKTRVSEPQEHFRQAP